MLAMLNKLGEVPYGYQAPTGYPDMAEDWVNTGALLERLNFAIAIASNRIPGTTRRSERLRRKDKTTDPRQGDLTHPRRRDIAGNPGDAGKTARPAAAGS